MATATAIETGFFGAVRQPGESFEVPEGTKGNSWFTVDTDQGADSPAPKKGKKGSEAPTDHGADSPADQNVI